MLKKIVLILTAALFIPFAVAQDLDYGVDEFIANFDIDSAHTTDGTNYKISATGEAGLYGRVWLSYEFTDKLGLGDSGELRALRGRKMVSSSPPPHYKAFIAERAAYSRCTHSTWCRTG